MCKNQCAHALRFPRSHRTFEQFSPARRAVSLHTSRKCVSALSLDVLKTRMVFGFLSRQTCNFYYITRSRGTNSRFSRFGPETPVPAGSESSRLARCCPKCPSNRHTSSPAPERRFSAGTRRPGDPGRESGIVQSARVDVSLRVFILGSRPSPFGRSSFCKTSA